MELIYDLVDIHLQMVFYISSIFYNQPGIISSFVISFFGHSFINPLVAVSIYENTFYFRYIYTLFIFLFGVTLDISFYFLGKKLSKHTKNAFKKKRFFYIFARFIPIFGIFSVFFGALFSQNFNKKDMQKIIIGNIIFFTFSLIFWGIFYYLQVNYNIESPIYIYIE